MTDGNPPEEGSNGNPPAMDSNATHKSPATPPLNPTGSEALREDRPKSVPEWPVTDLYTRYALESSSWPLRPLASVLLVLLVLGLMTLWIFGIAWLLELVR
jgi:hypothetical protein